MLYIHWLHNSTKSSHYLRHYFCQIIIADRLSLFATLIFTSVDINIAETFLCPFHTFLSHENKLCIWNSVAVDRPCVHSECWLLCTTNFHCVQFFRQNPLKLHSIEFAWFNKLHVFSFLDSASWLVNDTNRMVAQRCRSKVRYLCSLLFKKD